MSKKVSRDGVIVSVCLLLCVHFELRHLRLFPLLLLVSLWLILAHASPLLFSSFAASIPTPDEMYLLVQYAVLVMMYQ